MPIDPKVQSFFHGLGGLLSRAVEAGAGAAKAAAVDVAEAAVDSALDEVQEKVRAIDTRISTARTRAKARRRNPESTGRGRVVDAEVVGGSRYR